MFHAIFSRQPVSVLQNCSLLLGTIRKRRSHGLPALIESLENRDLLTTVFFDNFNQTAGSQPHSGDWSLFNIVDPNNNNVQYTNSISTLSVIDDPHASDGKALEMRLMRDPNDVSKFVSSEIWTKDSLSAGQLSYGRVEARIQLPGGPNGAGNGAWPAFWMIGSDFDAVGWPGSGEIDIMEFNGSIPNQIQSTLHGPGYDQPGLGDRFTLPEGESFYASYHLFAVDWAPDLLVFSVDGIAYSQFTPADLGPNSSWVFNKPFRIILNVAQGGPFAGPETPQTIYPLTMKVDYVKATSAGIPILRAMYPESGPSTGGTSVVMTGVDFDEATQVHFGTVPAASFEIISPTQIVAISPPSVVSGSEEVSVTVTSAGGTSTGRLYRYGTSHVDIFTMPDSIETNLDTFVVSGSAISAGNIVLVNGVPLSSAYVGEDHEFAMAWPLSVGTNNLTVEVQTSSSEVLLTQSTVINRNPSLSTAGRNLLYVDAVDAKLAGGGTIDSPLDGTIVIDTDHDLILGIIAGEHLRGVSADRRFLYMSDRKVYRTSDHQNTGNNLAFTQDLPSNGFLVSPTGDRLYSGTEVLSLASNTLISIGASFDITAGNSFGGALVSGGPGISADGTRVWGARAFGSEKRVFSISTDSARTLLTTPQEAGFDFLGDAAVSPDGNLLVLSFYHASLVYDAHTLELLHTVPTGDFAGKASFLNNHLVAVGVSGNPALQGGGVVIFDALTGARLSFTPQMLADNLAFSNTQDELFATSGSRFGVDSWNLNENGTLSTLKSFNLGINNFKLGSGIPEYDQIGGLFYRPAPVVGINRSSPLAATTYAENVSYSVEFGEDVMGVDATDFQLILNGVAVTNPISVAATDSPARYTVSITGISGTGTLGLNLVDNNSIRNLSGVSLAGGGDASFTGQVYIFTDVTRPKLTSITPLDDATGVRLTASIVLGFHEPIVKGAGSIVIRRTSDNSIFQSFDQNSADVQINGKQLTVQHLPFQGNTGYYVEVSTTAINDLAGNSFIGILTAGLWNFTTTSDVARPVLTSISPVDDATNFPRTGSIVLGFNEPVAKGTGSIVLRRSSDHSIFQSLDVNSPDIQISNTNVTILHPAFVANTGYYVEVSTTAITDLAGNAFIGIIGSTLWNFTTTADVTPPVLTAISPLDDAANVPLNANIVLGFGEAVIKGSGSLLIRRTSDHSVFQSLDVNAGGVLFAGNTVTIQHQAFLPDTSYYMEIPPTAITDTVGNSFIGIVGSSLWNFTSTTDMTPPLLTAISPLDDAGNVPLNANIVLGFGEAVTKGSGSLLIRRTLDHSVFQSLDVNAGGVLFAGNTVTIQHQAFLPDTSYYMEVPVTAITDTAGNPFIGIVGSSLWNFTSTSDVARPQLMSISPLDDSTDIPVRANIVLGFNESIAKGTGSIVIRHSIDNTLFQILDIHSDSVQFSGNTVTIQHEPFVANTSYYVEVSTTAIKDSVGNFFIGIIGATLWNFTTSSDVVPPQLISISPLDNALNVPVGANILMGFNETVVKGIGSIIIRRSNDNVVFQTIDVNSAKVQIVGSVVTIQHDTFATNTSYFLEVPNSVLTDIFGNPFIGITGASLWNFATTV